MSMDPAMIQAMLTQQLSQTPQAGSMGGGGMAGPRMQGSISPMNGVSNLMQKIMLMRALQGQRTSPGQPIQQPQPNMLGGINGIPQQMNQQPIPGGSNA